MDKNLVRYVLVAGPSCAEDLRIIDYTLRFVERLARKHHKKCQSPLACGHMIADELKKLRTTAKEESHESGAQSHG